MKLTGPAIALFCVAALLLAAPFAIAADDETAHAAHTTHAAGHQTDLLHWDLGAALWSIGVFVLLLIILSIAAWKPILNGLNSREAFITNSLAEAKRERHEAQQLLADYTARIERAKNDATAIVEEGRRDAEETRRRILAEAQQEADATVARAKRDIELARDDAMKRIHDQSVALASAMAGRLVRRELTTQDHENLLNESLAELRGMN